MPDKIPYMVFSGKKWENVIGKTGVNWTHDESILGVFFAETAEDACKQAAKKTGKVGTFFAVAGYTWGIDHMAAPSRDEYGVPENAGDRLARLENLIERGMESAGLLNRGDDG